MKIDKRKKETFNPELIELLEKKYPRADKKTNVQYKRDLDYIAYDVEFHTSDEFDLMINEGHDAVLFYQFIREKIGHSEDGYKYEVTIDSNTKVNKHSKLIRDASYYLHITQARAEEIYRFLVENGILIEIPYENRMWVLDEYSVWNFEIINSSRVQSRKSTANSRGKKKASDTNVEPDSNEAYTEVPPIPYEDLPPSPPLTEEDINAFLNL